MNSFLLMCFYILCLYSGCNSNSCCNETCRFSEMLDNDQIIIVQNADFPHKEMYFLSFMSTLV